MHSIFALILSAIIALSGMGAVSPIPETATQTTIREITLTINDTTYDIAAQPVFTGALGSEYGAGAFGILLNEEVLLPIRAALDTSTARIAIGNSGKVYSIAEQTLLQDVDMNAFPMYDMQRTLRSISDAKMDFASGIEANRASYETLKGVLSATASVGEATLSGAAVPLESYAGTLDPAAIGTLVDNLMNSDDLRISNYLKRMLEFANATADTQYASFGEAIIAEAADADFPDIAMTLDTAERGDDFYIRTTADISAAEPATDMHIESVARLENGSYHNDATIVSRNDALPMVLESLVDSVDVFTDSPRTTFSVRCGSVAETDAEAEPSFSLAMDGAMEKMNGLDNIGVNFTMRYGSDAYMGSDSFRFDASFALNDAPAENGGVDSTVSVTVNVEDQYVYALSFVANRLEIPFDADALFADEAEVALTCADDDPGMNSLLMDALALSNDLSTLMTEDEGILALRGDFYEWYYGDSDDDASDIPTPDDHRIEDGLEYLPADRVMARFEGTKFAFDMPEGFSVCTDSTYINTENTFANIRYRNADGSRYIEVNLLKNDSRENEYLVLNGDGAAAPVNGSVVTLYGFENGSYYGASLRKDDVMINLHFNDMQLSDVQALLATLHVAE